MRECDNIMLYKYIWLLHEKRPTNSFRSHQSRHFHLRVHPKVKLKFILPSISPFLLERAFHCSFSLDLTIIREEGQFSFFVIGKINESKKYLSVFFNHNLFYIYMYISTKIIRKKEPNLLFCMQLHLAEKIL